MLAVLRLTVLFFFLWYGGHRLLLSFPTRRSSDLLESLPQFAIGTNQLWEIVQAKIQESTRKRDRKSTRLNSSHRTISYAVFCLKKKKSKSEKLQKGRLPAEAKVLLSDF